MQKRESTRARLPTWRTSCYGQVVPLAFS